MNTQINIIFKRNYYEVTVLDSTTWRRKFISKEKFNFSLLATTLNDMFNDIEAEMMELADWAANAAEAGA